MYKLFHLLVPCGGLTTNPGDTARFAAAWDSYAAAVAALAESRDGFCFYTRTPRTEADAEPGRPGDRRYRYEGVDTFAFETQQSATDFRAVVRGLDASFLHDSSAWLIAEEHLTINGAPKGPLDTGRGIHVLTSMRRRRGMETAQFRRHWSEGVQYVTASQGLSRFAANPIVDEEYVGATPPIDGLVEAWFRTPGDLRACFSDPIMTGIHRAHNSLFIDTSSFFTLMCVDSEQWVVGARPDARDARSRSLPQPLATANGQIPE